MTTPEATVTEGAPEQVRLAITGMTCASCSARIERKLGKVPGVDSATVNLATEKAFVSFSAPVTVEQIVAEVEKTGYGASVIGAAPPDHRAGMPSGELPGAGALLDRLRSRHAGAPTPGSLTRADGGDGEGGQATDRHGGDLRAGPTTPTMPTTRRPTTTSSTPRRRTSSGPGSSSRPR